MLIVVCCCGRCRCCCRCRCRYSHYYSCCLYSLVPSLQELGRQPLPRAAPGLSPSPSRWRTSWCTTRPGLSTQMGFACLRGELALAPPPKGFARARPGELALARLRLRLALAQPGPALARPSCQVRRACAAGELALAPPSTCHGIEGAREHKIPELRLRTPNF